jgi:hypothetical protein
MKKLVAFVMILGLGLFCATGCGNKPPEKKVEQKPAAGAPAPEEKKAGNEKPATPPATPPAPEKK